MLIVCPNCATSYEVEPPALGPDGRSVRCNRCQKVWFAALPTLVPALGTVEDLDIVDNGPRIPRVDAPLPPLVEADAQWDNFQGELEPEQRPEVLEELPPEQPEAPMESLGPEPASIEGIDLGGLSAEIEAEREHQVAEADRILAEVTGDAPLHDAPPLVPPVDPQLEEQEPQAAAMPTAELREDIEAFAARQARREALRKRRRWPVPGLPGLILVLVAANAVLVAWRSDVVRLLPQTASAYAAIGMPVNLRGISFENIKTSREMQDGVAVLVVEGTIVNVTNRPAEIPRLRLAVRNDSKNEIYSWTTLPTRSILGPAEELPFRSRLASPPADGRDVLVRFFNRRDLVAGLR